MAAIALQFQTGKFEIYITERILTLFQQEVKKDGKMAEQFCQALFDGKAAEVESLFEFVFAEDS